jgi:hypothetical protein
MNQLSNAATVLGRAGLKKRWDATPPAARREFARRLAAARWPSYARALELEQERKETNQTTKALERKHNARK